MTKYIKKFYIFFIKLLLKLGVDNSNKVVMDLIYSDLYRYTATTAKKDLFKLIENDTGFQFTFFLRMASIKPSSRIFRYVHAFSYIFHKKYFIKYGYQIPISTKIGKGLQLLHFGNVVINSKAVIGNNCTIAQGVLIGQSNRGVPKIGNKVWIGANSILVGNITVGNNVLIAPGSFVNSNIPDNSLVMGNPSITISKSNAIINGYIVNSIDENYEFNANSNR